MNRRNFIRLMAVTLTIISTFGCVSQPKIKDLGYFPIVQGLTNATGTQIAVVVPRGLDLKFTYVINGEKPPIPKVINATVRESKNSNTVVHHLMIEELRPGFSYRLIISDLSGNIRDARNFRSLDLSERPARVLIASCLYDYFLKESVGMWKAVVDSKPEMIFLVGDNVYAEISNGRFPSPLNEQALWIRYVETFSVLDFYKVQNLIPTVVTWDDHDYGMKDGNRNNPHKLEAKYVMESFFPQTPSNMFPEFQPGPGVSSKLEAFGHNFLLLDDRSFRSPAGLPALEQTHFGPEQEKWIEKNVAKSKKPVWLISGDQWFGGYHRFESYEGTHPDSFKTFLKSIRNPKVPVMFASGDRHMSEVNRVESDLLGFETYEFTSSSLHSKTHPANWDTIPNKRQLYGADMKHNFTFFDLTPMAKDNSVKLKGAAIGTGSETLYAFDLKVQAKKVRP